MMAPREDQARFDTEQARLHSQAKPYAVATVVRTVNATSAIPGAKALLDANGAILEGWIGGGCVHSALGAAARAVIAARQPRLISIRPQEALDADGITPGEERDGVHFARNGCPSQGTLDIFIEPVLPRQELVICGASPVAQALAHLAGRFDFNLTLCAQADVQSKAALAGQAIAGFDFAAHIAQPAYVVVATQGQGDLPALEAALTSPARYVGFVGSRRKFASLSATLAQDRGYDPAHLARVHSPAGLDLSAITPDEIALSILAQIIALRRAPDPNQQTGARAK